MDEDIWKRRQTLNLSSWQQQMYGFFNNPRPTATGLQNQLGGTFLSTQPNIPMAAIKEMARLEQNGHEVGFVTKATASLNHSLSAYCSKCKGRLAVSWPTYPDAAHPHLTVTGALASDLTCAAVVLQSLKRGQRVRFRHNGIVMEGYIIGRQKELCKKPLVRGERCWMVHVDTPTNVNSNWHDRTGTLQPQWMCLATPEDDQLEILEDVDD